MSNQHPRQPSNVLYRAGCPLCDGTGGRVLFSSNCLRVIHADESGFPAFYRVVWNAHVAEFSDLSRDERMRCMDAVVLVEQCLREHLTPTKINLAALGNAVPHLHWHVVARFEGDSHFPGSVWAAAQRERQPEHEAAVALKIPALELDLIKRLGAGDF
jgi:diadenosine tetraphosphate (Ap4A) HIT family hydrolase